MLRKFLSGLLFGAGFAIAFIAVVFAYFKYINLSSYDSEPQVVTEVPKLQPKSDKFYGSSASFSGEFIENRNNELVEGDALIIGSVLADGKPAVGLKLRLGLNGKVMSQWASTDAKGNYYISVPSGDYRVEGYELDYDSSVKVLAGLIDAPRHGNQNKSFTINSEKHGVGIELSYVTPVKKIITNNSFTLDGEIIISWKEYPSASSYDVQLYEKQTANDYSSTHLFRSSKKTNNTSLNINEHTDELKVGFYYSYNVRALDENDLPISSSYRDFSGYDFKVLNN